MKIVIDCRFWGPRHTGLGVYTQNLVNNLVRIDTSNSYVLLVKSESVGDLPQSNNLSYKIVDIEAYSLKEQFVLPFIIYSLKPDLVHFTSINVPILFFGNYVVTIHDLIKHNFTGPQTTTRNHVFYWIKQFGYLFIFWLLTLLSKKIIIPSYEIMRELNSRYPHTKSKTHVIYEASTLKNIKQSNLTSDLPKKFCIYTGNAYPHKNLNLLIDSWKDVYAATNCQLLLVCGRGIFAQRVERVVKEKMAEDFVRFAGYVSDEDLVALYKKAVCFVFPTLSEGFGLPGLDAMQVGLPVVCSNIPVLKEIYGDSATYFNPKDKHNMAENIVEMIKNESLQKKFVKLGESQVKKYSWQKAAKESLEIFGKCLE